MELSPYGFEQCGVAVPAAHGRALVRDAPSLLVAAAPRVVPVHAFHALSLLVLGSASFGGTDVGELAPSLEESDPKPETEGVGRRGSTDDEEGLQIVSNLKEEEAHEGVAGWRDGRKAEEAQRC